MSFKEFFETNLNPEQQQVVAPEKGVLLVCAGAGSGKTRVITARMANLMLEHGVKPNEIIALTFTNKAAREMKERISKFLGHESAIPYVGTFHAYCLRVLKSNAHLLPYSPFSLMDEADQEKLVKGIINAKGLSKKVTAKQILGAISRIKNEATNESERIAAIGNDILLRDLYDLYEKEKALARCFDFDDLLLQTLELFTKNELFKKAFQIQVRHVLVDEYQDTNKVQHALLKAMTKKENEFALDSLCVVGDEDQSIYSWRGANVTNIIHFSRDFPQAESVTIERNYRSVQPILHIANEVIKNNAFRNPKKLYSSKEASDRIRILTCNSGFHEGEALASFLKESRKQSSLNSHAVLYRSHFQSRSLEEALIRHAIPYKIMGGIQFYDRLEIKDMLSYMRLIVNPHDRLALSRALNTPSRGLGDKFEELFFETWNMMPFEDFRAIAQILLDNNKLTRTKAESLTSFINIFAGFTKETRPSTVLTSIIERTGYYAHLNNAFEKDDAEAKRENLKELINGVLFFEERHTPTLDAFLEEVSLLQEQMNANEDSSDFIPLMTFHAAKGLEFDTVILAGIEEGILPSARSMYNPEALEEERRLLYVGITRARERLLIMHTKHRYTYGQHSDQHPSRFLDEIPDEFAHYEDGTYFKERDFERYFQQWLSGEKPALSFAPKQSHSYSQGTSYGSSPRSEHSNGYYAPAFKDNSDDSFTDSSSSEDSDEHSWKQYQSVMHANFGRGVIERIERKSSGTFLTVRFKSGIKKLAASFLAPL